MAHEHTMGDTGERFVIDVATRNITIPEGQIPLLTQYDHNSEHITFECGRYIEKHDLASCTKVKVHYNNIGRSGRQTSHGFYEPLDLKVDPKDSSKVIFTWIVSRMATLYAGSVAFVVEFSCLDEDGEILYSWNTNINKELKVSEGINNNEVVATMYADVLEMWKNMLFGIGDTEEASIMAVSEEQQKIVKSSYAYYQQAIDVKIAEALKSIPDEYMDYSEFEQSKADVDDINRLLDSDLITSRATNLYPYGDASFEYNGEGLYTGVSAGRSFYLDEGNYWFVVTDTNAVGIYVMLDDGNDTRLLEIKDNHIGFHQFTVQSQYANQPLVVKFYASASTANEAGTYYLKHPYIFSKAEHGVIADEFLIKSPAKILESDLVKRQLGDNLYTGGDIEFEYDGVQTYKGKESARFTLEEGDYTITILDSNAIFYVLYVAPSGSDATRIFATAGPLEEYKFTITSEYANVPLVLMGNASLATANEAGNYYVRSVYIHKDNGASYLPEFFTNNILKNSITKKLSGAAYKAENGSLSVVADSLESNGVMKIDAMCNVKTNKSLIFTAKFDAFTGLRVGHGRSSYGGSYIEISGSNINVYQYTTSAAQSSTHAHGLTFSEFITVIIKAGVTTADITVFTAGGSYMVSQVEWSGCNGDIFADSINTAFSDCELKWTASCVKEKVWVFGDSYLGFNDRRWAGQMHNLGYKNWLASGYPGGGSSQELASLNTLLTLGKPDIIVWCMGMNNGDSGAINSTWLSCVNEMLTLCADNNITPVLATIPTCPEVDNAYKNEWVRDSGHRYVDFAKAVGVNGTSWYDGMLSGDNIHPSELGAKALAARVCVDVPEITR